MAKDAPVEQGSGIAPAIHRFRKTERSFADLI
jgi:hypothetical protein